MSAFWPDSNETASTRMLQRSQSPTGQDESVDGRLPAGPGFEMETSATTLNQETPRRTTFFLTCNDIPVEGTSSKAGRPSSPHKWAVCATL
ncbi:unnamed protein product [Protopolystoma xenopodis]|uniref:Uncharacterized protein n=1 Tax=Protopolystoma xenopodis TaxID=117903 RepID=A0A448WFS8_9PLAT|nr:unnamed protein product [Protopolystoma xenopodis]